MPPGGEVAAGRLRVPPRSDIARGLCLAAGRQCRHGRTVARRSIVDRRHRQCHRLRRAADLQSGAVRRRCLEAGRRCRPSHGVDLHEGRARQLRLAADLQLAEAELAADRRSLHVLEVGPWTPVARHQGLVAGRRGLHYRGKTGATKRFRAPSMSMMPPRVVDGRGATGRSLAPYRTAMRSVSIRPDMGATPKRRPTPADVKAPKAPADVKAPKAPADVKSDGVESGKAPKIEAVIAAAEKAKAAAATKPGTSKAKAKAAAIAAVLARAAGTTAEATAQVCAKFLEGRCLDPACALRHFPANDKDLQDWRARFDGRLPCRSGIGCKAKRCKYYHFDRGSEKLSPRHGGEAASGQA
eukprot:gnl/TRDRNA2_/TRDRNA2_162200_c4_seq2.p2 gnl/TRDRNA2_/TRDRNA2_162200_c4~~gnl/TRDRNA2_/TRDRNA2_162200_c4_seq2.p2  ORF type:complete len:355 (-),score=58.17 gnl/TRDRNA2_/TRDRNA2_162200_c4_seq2:31-1095(-)